MALAFDKPKSYIGLLQTKLRDREEPKARRVGLAAMPLDQPMEGGHGEREPRLTICPHPVHDPLAMADQGQHREPRLHQHLVLPLAARTPCEMGGIARGGMEAGITQGN